MSLTPSPELDRRIAEACGANHFIDSRGDVYIWRESHSERWRPSINLSHAWEAGEAVELFDDYMLGKDHDGYFLYGTCEKLPDGSRVEGALVTESTPALAICAAVLAVSKSHART